MLCSGNKKTASVCCLAWWQQSSFLLFSYFNTKFTFVIIKIRNRNMKIKRATYLPQNTEHSYTLNLSDQISRTINFTVKCGNVLGFCSGISMQLMIFNKKGKYLFSRFFRPLWSVQKFGSSTIAFVTILQRIILLF